MKSGYVVYGSLYESRDAELCGVLQSCLSTSFFYQSMHSNYNNQLNLASSSRQIEKKERSSYPRPRTRT